MMDGRVKTLHPKIHGGLLAVRGKRQRTSARSRITPSRRSIFSSSIFIRSRRRLRAARDFDACIENIDIGGPALIRAGAKNHASVTVVIDPEDYGRVLDEMEEHDGATTLELRKTLAAKAFARTGAYDAAICVVVLGPLGDARLSAASSPEDAPKCCAMARTRIKGPPSTAPAIGASASPLLCSFRARSSPTTISTTPTPPTSWSPSLTPKVTAAVAIIKHANPCGVAVGIIAGQAYTKALMLRSCQRVRRRRRAQPLPRRAGGARDRQDLHRGDHRARCERRGQGDRRRQEESAPFARRRPAGPEARRGSRSARVAGGFLLQSRETGCASELDLKIVTKRRAERGRACRHGFRLHAWRSTSSRTPSSTPRTARRSASALGR